MVQIEQQIDTIAAEADIIFTSEQRRKWAEHYRREHDELKIRIRAQAAKSELDGEEGFL